MTTLLDLGVGTGLELTEIYRRYPTVQVTGVDLCQPMLSLCAQKFQAQRPTLLCKDYLEHDFGCDAFDAAVSFETLHHLNEAEKMILYRRLYTALHKGGRYVQGDYAARDAIQEAALLSEFQAVSADNAKTDGQRVHFDTPFTAEHDCALLRGAGFDTARAVWQEGNTVLIVADKAS